MSKRYTPYSQTKVSVGQSIEKIRRLLQNYGASACSFPEDWERDLLRVQFIYRNLPVEVQVNLRKVIGELEGADPYTSRRRKSLDQYRAEKREQATRTAYRYLFAWLKVSLETAEYGIFEFEDVFLPHFVPPLGTIGALVKKRLAEITNGSAEILAITEGVINADVE